jgi:ElaB/YqjD/DUF883 family membrane-anchored ribosome-binding protein
MNEETMETTNPTIDEPMEAARTQAERTRDDLQNIAADVEERARQLWDQAAVFVRENPGMAVGAALVGGVVIGGLLSRPARRSEGMAESQGKKVGASLDEAKVSVTKTLTDLRNALDQVIQKVQ